MDKFIEYAPIIIVVIGFLVAYRIFVTPVQMREAFSSFEHEIEKKFVQKEVYDLANKNFETTIADMKDKIDKIYDRVMGIN